MTKPTPRADLVKAVGDAAAIVEEALPVSGDDDPEWQQEMRTLQAAALPVILRELLDVEVTA
jgi:hypothetical protein